MSRYISFITLLIVIVLLVVLSYKVMVGFFIPLFLAALLVVVFRPIHNWILNKCKGRQRTAAFLTTAAIMLSVLVPLAILFALAAFESQQLVRSIKKKTLIRNIEVTREKLNLELPEIAEELNEVEIRLDNISQIEQLEDISYLDTGQLANTAVLNDQLASYVQEQFENAVGINSAWSEYIAEFEKLEALQLEIASPEPDESDESETSAKQAAQKLFDFQKQTENTIKKFANFKVQVLGGSPFWVWLKELANPTSELLEEYGSLAIGYLRTFVFDLGTLTTAFLGKLLLGGAIMIISVYFFLLDGPAMLASLKNLSPIDDEHEQELIVEFGKVSRAVVVATLLAALVQALLGGIGYYFAGLDSVFLLTLLTGCLALVPFVGAAAVWLPCSLWLYFVENEVTAAIGLALYGVLIVSMSDNLIKPLVLHGQSNLHPLFALLSVLGGVAALGPIGILIGPMIVAFLQTLLKILQREMASIDQERQIEPRRVQHRAG